MLVSKIVVDGKLYKTGDKLEFKGASDLRGYNSLSVLKKGELVQIAIIQHDKSGENLLFGIATTDNLARGGWHTLDGCLRKDNGYFIEKCHIINNFRRVSEYMVINKNFPFKKKNLKDMKCKVVSPMPGNSESLVEFKEDIGGCGADGLGKGGHCLVVPNDILSSMKEEVKTEVKKSKSKVK